MRVEAYASTKLSNVKAPKPMPVSSVNAVTSSAATGTSTSQAPMATQTISKTFGWLERDVCSLADDNSAAVTRDAPLFRHPEVAAERPSKDERPRRPGRRPSRLAALAPQCDGTLAGFTAP